MDSLNASKNMKHKNHRTFAFNERKTNKKYPLQSLINQEHRGIVNDLDQIVRKQEEIHLGFCQKYRPKSFKDFIGQNIVRKYLINAIVKLKIAPLYLFYGPRGTGKTSAARIFASALNCSSPNRKSKPCCECSECCLCLSGKNPHIVELNVASSDASEKLKLCFETVKSNNVTSGCRVFIIKDCQQLSPEAWNNEILKCMENPTDYVVFILITVDLELVPKAAITRCQKFYFQKLRDADISNMLENIAVAEKINIEDKALYLITERAGGSLRDAEIALERISFLSSTVTVSRVFQTLLHLLEFALSGDKENTVRCTREIIDCGVKPLTLVTQLAALVKDALINSCLSTEAQENQYSFGMPYSSINRTEKLGRALKILSEVEKQLRVSNKCISWLTAALLLFVSVELNSNSHSIVDTEIDEKDSAYEDKITCHYTDQSNQYEAPDTSLSASKVKTIEAKNSGIVDSLDKGYEFPQNITNRICNFDMSKPVHFHDIENYFPIRSPSPNCTSETGKLDLNPMSPCKMEEIWQIVLKNIQFTTLEDSVQGQAKLVSLLECKDYNEEIASEFIHSFNQGKDSIKGLREGEPFPESKDARSARAEIAHPTNGPLTMDKQGAR
ncbi:protein STICHEL-like 4 [Cryptomeria japonica]|uniref:protein STICHEL-like 4 n=1 Tax=Cryptomeria japonica TaxID=3369 RepID=UPI0027D9F812|nr:protein STICHEL-like 4 [Cryptomeria japonica]